MILEIDKFLFDTNDHCWIEYTDSSDYSSNHQCDGCSSTMTDVIYVTNDKKEKGLSIGLCEECGYIKTTRNLKPEILHEHFTNRWLNLRSEGDYHPSDRVYRLIKPFLADSSDLNILDIGCGAGEQLAAFEERGFNTFGVEPSKSRTETARKHLKKTDITTGFAEDFLQTTNTMFDIMFIENVMQFVENPFRLLDLAIKRLNSGGVLYIRAQRFDYSNFAMFSMIAVIRSYVSLYSLKNMIMSQNLNILSHSDNPFVLILKKDSNLDDKTRELLSSTQKVDARHIQKEEARAFGGIVSMLTGSVKIKNKAMNRLMEFKIIDRKKQLPIQINSNNSKLPVILK